MLVVRLLVVALVAWAVAAAVLRVRAWWRQRQLAQGWVRDASGTPQPLGADVVFTGRCPGCGTEYGVPGSAPIGRAWCCPATPPADRYQRDEGDETPEPDAPVAEGLGTPMLTPWPGFAAIEAVKRANPKLADIQAYAVAVARTRLPRKAAS